MSIVSTISNVDITMKGDYEAMKSPYPSPFCPSSPFLSFLPPSHFSSFPTLFSIFLR